MRQKRVRKSRNRSSKWGNIIIFFVIAPIVAILITAGLFRYLILPYIVSDDSPNNVGQGVQDDEGDSQENPDDSNQSTENPENTSDTISLRLDGMSLFNVQLGSFSSKENAQSLVDQLKKNEINGYMVENNGFKVFAGTFFSRGEAERYRDKLKSTYNDAFLKEFYIGGTTIEYQSVDKQFENEIVELVGIMEDSYSEEASLWAAAINSNNATDLKREAINNNNIIETKLSSIKTKVTSSSLLDLIASLEHQYIQRRDMVDRLVVSNSQSIKDSYEEFNNILYNYMRTITQGQ